MPGLDTFSASLAPETLTRQSPAMALPAFPGRAPLGAAMKRAMDVLGAGVLLALLAPVFLVLALLVRRDGAPAFYAHQRVGLSGRMFGCLKFRSMVRDSDARLKALLASDPAAREEWEATRKLRNDPRVTAVGNFLRKTSLDELPQLINVLRGEMSLVGPRPVTATELATFYGPAASLYASVRPGITGLWQVSGRSETSYAQRVALDVDYAAHPSLWTDIKILLRTPVVVVARKGAV
ncbi:sugar transferase [Rhodovarius lipocyclicus]|uniref:sugar transferase n=1 Tax=Rhodovarius lipocyclicus TaxID=268410 RepID=UPI00135B75CF|nr:sugar transferase [Rhodovarius lipocyclicus]